MATKFGYVERDANTRVNWGDIGKSFSDMLITTREKGEAEFKALDNLATVAADVEVPLGANTTWNQIFMDNANDIKAFSVSNNKAWKNGDITTYEYQRRLQNLTDNSDLLIKTQQNLNKQYANLVKSSTDGTMSDYTRQNMDNLMRFTNLNNTRIVIQKDGTMVGNKVISDGKGGFVNSTDPNDTVSLQAFGNIFLQDVKEFDSNAALDKVVAKLGDYEYVFKELATYTKAGTLFKVKDITAMDSDAFVSKEIKEAGNAFLEAEEAALGEIMADPFQAVSVLMDGVGGFTNCKPGEDCKGSKNIKQEYTEGGLLMPSLTEEQIDMGKDFLRSQFRAKLDRTVAATSTGRVTRPSYRKTPTDKTGFVASDFTENMAMLWYGNQSQVETAERYLKGLNKDIQRIRRTPKGVVIYYSGGKEADTIPFYNAENNLISQRDWLTGNTNYFLSQKNQVKDVNTILNTMNFDPTQSLSNVTAEVKSLSSLEAAKNYIKSDSFEITDETFTDFKKNDVKKEIEPILNKYTKGAKISTGWGNNITIKIPNQPPLELSADNSAEENKRLLKDFLANNVDAGQSARLMQTGDIDVLAGGEAGGAGEAEEVIEDKTGGTAR